MHHVRRAFTLIELLLVIGIIAVVAGIVILAINPGKQFGTAQNAKRLSDTNQLEKALNQYMIDKGAPPDVLSKYSRDPAHPTPICSPSATDTAVCIDVSPLVAQYIAAVPKDPTEPCFGVTGYGAYIDKMGPHVLQKHDDDLVSCPVSIFWSDATHAIVRNGMVTLTGSLAGKTITVAAGSSLNLNGYNVTGGSIVNNGTIVANGNETADVAGGAWKIVGNTGDLSVLGNQGTLSSLSLAPTVAGTVFKPMVPLTVSGQLTVGDTAILDTTAANSAFGGAVKNYGAIILGDNTVHFNGGYDAQNGQTVFIGTALPSLLTYHHLTIASANAALSGNTNIAGTLTVLAGDKLNLTAGNTLNVGQGVNLGGTLMGQGTLNVAGGSVAVAAGGLLTGQDATHLLTLSGLTNWILQNAGSVQYLTLHNAQSSLSVSCTGCQDGGGNSQTISYTHVSPCGNGTVDASETCDDGNTVNGDGCSAVCQQEPGWDCSTDPTWCVATVGTAGSDGAALAAAGGKVYVDNLTDFISVIDTTNGNAVTTVPVPGYHTSVAAIGGKAFVPSNEKNYVSVVDTQNGNSVTKVTVGQGPEPLITLGTSVYVANTGTHTVSVIDADTNAVTATVNVGPSPIAFATMGTNVYVSTYGYVSVIDSATNHVTTTVNVGTYLRALTVLGTKVYGVDYSGNSVTVIDTQDGNSVSTVAVGTSPWTLTALGTNVYVANLDDNTVSIIDTTHGDAVTTVQVGSSPDALATYGNKVYVANEYDNTVSIIDTTHGNAVTTVPVGGYPWALTVLGNFVYVDNSISSFVSIIAGH